MQAVLVMFKSDGERRSFSLPRDITVIGRREDCDLRIPLGDVSRKHCRLIKEGEELRIEDLGSSNGTFLNGMRIQEATLQAGDQVQIGPVGFIIQLNGQPTDDDIHPFAPPPGMAQSTDGGDVIAAPAADDLAPIEELPAVDEFTINNSSSSGSHIAVNDDIIDFDAMSAHPAPDNQQPHGQ